MNKQTKDETKKDFVEKKCNRRKKVSMEGGDKITENRLWLFASDPNYWKKFTKSFPFQKTYFSAKKYFWGNAANLFLRILRIVSNLANCSKCISLYFLLFYLNLSFLHLFNYLYQLFMLIYSL